MDRQLQAKRFDIAIKVMLRVALSGKHAFYLGSWRKLRSVSKDPLAKLFRGEINPEEFQKQATEEETIGCGTAACFSGWMAVAPEARSEGAGIGTCGAMTFEGESTEKAIAEFLGISVVEAHGLVYGDAYYGCAVPDVTAADVVLALEKLRVKYVGSESEVTLNES